MQKIILTSTGFTNRGIKIMGKRMLVYNQAYLYKMEHWESVRTKCKI